MLMMFCYNVTFYFLTRERSYLLFFGAVLLIPSIWPPWTDGHSSFSGLNLRPLTGWAYVYLVLGGAFRTVLRHCVLSTRLHLPLSIELSGF